ncbi:MAG TPA: hypothetical protein VK572_00460 [Burkholderiales bacterium]|nr:hypothetical protein [Burkholderiales bacterium]
MTSSPPNQYISSNMRTMLLALLLALVAGLAAPVVLLHGARTAAPGANPLMLAGPFVASLAALSALLAALAPRFWIAIFLLVSGPVALVCLAMLWAFAAAGNPFYIWLYVAAASLASAALAAALAARFRTRGPKPGSLPQEQEARSP